MATSVSGFNHWNEYIAKIERAKHLTVLEIGRDILVDAKRNAPYKDGGLRRESDVQNENFTTTKVRFYAEYAGYQERGSRKDGSRVVRRYTTGGTGAHFLENAGIKAQKTAVMIFKKHVGSIR